MPEPLNAWIKDTGDLGFVLPETKLVKEHIWPPDGKQPTTPAAEVQTSFGSGNGKTVKMFQIECEDPGASIGYRVSDSQKFSGPWRVYGNGASKPVFAGDKEVFLQVQSHRIGHKPSVVVLQLDNSPK